MHRLSWTVFETDVCIDIPKQNSRLMCASTFLNSTRDWYVSTFGHITCDQCVHHLSWTVFATNECIDFLKQYSRLMCASTLLNSIRDWCVHRFSQTVLGTYMCQLSFTLLETNVHRLSWIVFETDVCIDFRKQNARLMGASTFLNTIHD